MHSEQVVSKTHSHHSNIETLGVSAPRKGRIILQLRCYA